MCKYVEYIFLYKIRNTFTYNVLKETSSEITRDLDA